MKFKNKIGPADLEGATRGTFVCQVKSAELIETDLGKTWRFNGHAILVCYDENGEEAGQAMAPVLYLPVPAAAQVVMTLEREWGPPQEITTEVMGKMQETTGYSPPHFGEYVETTFNIEVIPDENSPVGYRYECSVPGVSLDQIAPPSMLAMIEAGRPKVHKAIEAGDKKKRGK